MRLGFTQAFLTLLLYVSCNVRLLLRLHLIRLDEYPLLLCFSGLQLYVLHDLICVNGLLDEDGLQGFQLHSHLGDYDCTLIQHGHTGYVVIPLCLNARTLAIEYRRERLQQLQVTRWSHVVVLTRLSEVGGGFLLHRVV